MPRTRNVTRSQWNAANNNTNTSSSRTRSQNENSVAESEKENAGLHGSRATRSQARTGGRTGLSAASNIAVLGATTGKANKTATKLKTASKGKHLPPTPTPKRKKQPLQDITAEFLPAQADGANRRDGAADDGLRSQADEYTNVVTALPPLEIATVSALPAPKFTSPLPPSSPPSDHNLSLNLHPISSAPKLLDNGLFSSTHSIPQEPYDPWQEFNDAHPGSEASFGNVSSKSDPFGFVSLERKLKADREAAASLAGQDDEDAGLILVADSSSPRAVRRLKRSLQDDEDELPEAVEEVHEHSHYATPPTPHKDKQKRRRLSHEGHDVFSPCSSSVEASPSPTKASTRKRSPHILSDDPLDKFNQDFDRSFEAEVAQESYVGPIAEEAAVDLDAVSRNLRSREKLQRRLHSDMAKEGQDEKLKSNKVVVKGKGKGKSVKTSVRKPQSAATRKNATTKQGGTYEQQKEDLEEKWERERQERREYFKSLESYKVEKEDVFLI